MIFDPLSLEHIGVTLGIALVEREAFDVPLTEPFAEGGVYALYYMGNHSAYAGLRALNAGALRYPVYVGKAVRAQAKKGFTTRPSNKTPLFDRINEHAVSIREATGGGLDISDFACRYLQLNDAHISLAESVLITTFRPPWNGMGFGSRVVGAFRMTQRASLWDSLHPGRGGRPAGDAERKVKALAQITQSQAALLAGPADATTQRMVEKIMKFA